MTELLTLGQAFLDKLENPVYIILSMVIVGQFVLLWKKEAALSSTVKELVGIAGSTAEGLAGVTSQIQIIASTILTVRGGVGDGND